MFAHVCIQRLNRELAIWRVLSHAHILPLLGVAHDAFGGGHTGYGFAMVCPWMEDGALHRFLGVKERTLKLSKRLDLVHLLEIRRILYLTNEL